MHNLVSTIHLTCMFWLYFFWSALMFFGSDLLDGQVNYVGLEKLLSLQGSGFLGQKLKPMG